MPMGDQWVIKYCKLIEGLQCYWSLIFVRIKGRYCKIWKISWTVSYFSGEGLILVLFSIVNRQHRPWGLIFNGVLF